MSVAHNHPLALALEGKNEIPLDEQLEGEDPSFVKWFNERYSERHHGSCEIIGYGTCTCIAYAKEDWKREQLK